MISALARTALILGDENYTAAAIKSGEFIWNNMRNKNGKLLRSYFEGVAAVEAELSDHAFLARAYLHLHDLTGEPVWFDRATNLFQTMEKEFGDPNEGDFFSSSRVNGFGRMKSRQDSDFASANGIALSVIANLSARTLGPDTKRRTEKLIASLSGFAAASPAGGSSILLASDQFLRNPTGPVQYGGGGAVRVHAIRNTDGTEITLRIKVADGWHVNADKPLEDYLIPTKIALKNSTADATFPEAKIKQLGFSEKPLALYEGNFDIQLEADSSASRTSNIELEIQTCSTEICLPPELLKFRIASPLDKK